MRYIEGDITLRTGLDLEQAARQQGSGEMALIDEVRRRARRASFEAERVVRVNRAQSKISTLQGQLSQGITRLGYLTYDLAGRNEIEHPQLRQFCDQLNQLRSQIAALEDDIRSIQVEQVPEEVTMVVCHACGTTCPAEARFCLKCGAVLAQAPAPAHQTSGLVCRSCGTSNAATMRFCTRCGQPLAGVAVASTSQDAPTVQVGPPSAVPQAAIVPSPSAVQIIGGPETSTTVPPESVPVPAAIPSGAEISPAQAPDIGTEPMPAAAIIARPEGLGGAAHPAEPAYIQGEEPAPSQAVSTDTDQAPVAWRCPSCGEALPADALFCVGCGQAVTSA